MNALVGTAISASLLPPIVNSGMLCSVYVCLRLRIGLGLRELGVDAAWRHRAARVELRALVGGLACESKRVRVIIT